ncbi:hypothetical protein HS088_TW11G00288 [Tripterygium wilfordii]|uniref:Methyltransferase type 11 domain-containing protein n=1 Tax=Tripterygium wilfordii TaxID=458696 RepID=A0A7J7D1J1_TRIWF|nr:uncharacterized methyltransferase At1g78140, chloroplastic [Tripterygium wilfordii]KAF5740222.1 hypothetical protein HS088_TW11G00288 [Tripterygium wilfordii]
MASTTHIIGNLSSWLHPIQPNNSRRCFFKPCTFPIFKLKATNFAGTVRAFSTAFIDTKPADEIVVEKGVSTNKNVLACPICYEPLTLIGDSSLSIDSTSTSKLQCKTCKKTYIGNKTHVDLRAASGLKEYADPMPPATELFRLPLVSFLYERGWRQNFALGGFPGKEKEFELAKGYLKPVLGGNIIDASCGSGLFSRLFAKSGLFSMVVALDYSENMLQQCYEFVEKEENFPKEKLTLVRADISRLPFVSSSIDAVHAGAAIHCWPSPSSAVAEISRVLRPGGVLVATTFILDGPFTFIPFFGIISQKLTQISGNRFFQSEREFEELCGACGLVGFQCIRNQRFVMFSARKPS